MPGKGDVMWLRILKASFFAQQDPRRYEGDNGIPEARLVWVQDPRVCGRDDLMLHAAASAQARKDLRWKPLVAGAISTGVPGTWG